MKLKELFEAKERSILSVMGKQEDPFPIRFSCSYNQLTSLQGAPSVVKGDFYCYSNKLTSLAGIHKIVKEIHGFANFYDNPIKSNVLGLMRIKGLTRVILANKQVENILNKYLTGDRDIIKCQSELLDAGLEEYAKL